jgi:hypothetical protein
MISSKLKTLTFLAVIPALAFTVATYTDVGASVATVILGTDTLAVKCTQALPEGKRDLPYEAIKSRIDTDSKTDIILVATSDKQCGSAGCAHELCLRTDTGATIISFGYAAETLVIKDTASNGMYDIQLQGKSTTNLQWDRTRYIILQ